MTRRKGEAKDLAAAALQAGYDAILPLDIKYLASCQGPACCQGRTLPGTNLATQLLKGQFIGVLYRQDAEQILDERKTKAVRL